MRVFSFLMATAAIAGSANAADKLSYSPPASWIVPQAFSSSSPKSGAPVDILLIDSQVRLGTAENATYTHIAVRINTPEGLAAASQSILWDPAFDTPTVHRLVARRGDKVIDLLAGDQKFTVLRREQELESQTLNGQLTAVLQPEGLQVGDIVEIESTIVRRDPTMRGHMEATAALSAPIAVDRAFMRVLYPKTAALRDKRFAGLGAPRTGTIGGEMEMKWSASPLKPEIGPEFAPQRFAQGPRYEVSDFASWASMATLFEPLFDKASRIDRASPLQGEVARIRAAANDPAKQAALALALVEDKIRYVNLALGSGGLVPASADDTWQRRFGDCKAKTALLVGLLRELRIDATPVLVHSELGDGMDERLPLVSHFNHVIVRSTIGGRTYWLDATRTGDASLEALETPLYHWGLPITANASLVRIVPGPPAVPTTEELVTSDVRGGAAKPLPTTIDMIFRGDAGRALNTIVSALDPTVRDAAIRKQLQSSLRRFTVVTASHRFDPSSGVLTLHGEGTQELELDNGSMWVHVPPPGYKADFRREATRDRDAPVALEFPQFSRSVHTILLPADRASRSRVLPSTFDETVAGVRYRRTVTNAGGKIVVDGTRQTLVPEISYADAKASEAHLRALTKNDVFVVLADATSADPEQVRAVLGKAPKSAADYVAAAVKFLGQNDGTSALGMLDEAIRLDPRHRDALSMRAMIRNAIGDTAGARTDADALLKVDPSNRDMLAVRAELARRDGSIEEVLKAADALAKVDNARAQINRANMLGDIGRTEQALAALDKALSYEKDGLTYVYKARLLPVDRKADRLAALRAGVALDPKDGYALRELAKLALQLGEASTALDLLNRAFLKQPDNISFRHERAIAMLALGQKQDAEREFDAVRARANGATELNNLCFTKVMANVELDRALKECDDAIAARDAPEYRDSRAWALLRLKRYDEAIADFDKVLSAAEIASSFFGRGLAWARKGDNEKSAADFSAAQRLSPASVREFGHYGFAP